jgi:hypothetical protein
MNRWIVIGSQNDQLVLRNEAGSLGLVRSATASEHQSRTPWGWPRHENHRIVPASPETAERWKLQADSK